MFGADDIKIDLNGHTIAGSGSGVGIVVTGRTDISKGADRRNNFKNNSFEGNVADTCS